MKNVRVLDCTLRDGGRIINCAFQDNEIQEITKKLGDAKIDIVEVGFLRDWRNIEYKGNSTFFTDVDQIAPFLDKSNKNVMYVAFIDFGMFDFDSLKPYDGTSIDGIRYGFTKKDYNENRDEIRRCAAIIKEKGYKLFIQGVNSLNYSDRELLELIDMINEIHPYSFGIVDTYGAMYIDDVDRLYGLIDHNMKSDICINFHSHNNYQLSFALAQEVIKLSNGTRQVIIDGTLNGVGKVAGNLNLELIVDFLVRKMHYDYEFDDILDMIDDYIYKYTLEHKWGYSVPAMMAGIYKSHPNNVIYLTEKFRLESKDIGKLLSMIDPQKRQRYDYDMIQKLYVEYVSDKVDDHESIESLKMRIQGKEVLLMVPGATLNTYREQIDSYVKAKTPVVISVNFVADDTTAIAFFGNQKRYNLSKKKLVNREVVVASNVHDVETGTVIVNYQGIINRGESGHEFKYFENSTIMLLNLLKKLEPSQISIAGFDGFDISINNYIDQSFQNDRHVSDFTEMNEEIQDMLDTYIETIAGKCEIEFITPSRFKK